MRADHPRANRVTRTIEVSKLSPVIILGAARSGTKFLRRLLAASAACAVVPYGVSYVWRYGNEAHPHDALPAAACTPSARRHIRRALLRLADADRHAGARYLVEKSSANTLRVPFVDAVFPEARYVHLVRDGCDAVESAHRRWTAPSEPLYLLKKPAYLLRRMRAMPLSVLRSGWWYLKNLLRKAMQGQDGDGAGYVWGPRYPGIARDVERLSTLAVCAKQWRACVNAALDGLEAIPGERVFYLRYEDLVTDPRVVTDLCAFLDLPDPAAVQAHYRAHVYAGAVGRGRRAMGEEAFATLRPILETTLERLGYAPAAPRTSSGR